jgi:hypothetical protein
VLFQLRRAEFLRPRWRLNELLALESVEVAGGRFDSLPLDDAFDRRTFSGYLSDLREQGLLERADEEDTGSLRLTDSGRKRLNYLLVDFMREMIQLHGAAEDILRRRLISLPLEGVHRVAFYPFSETAEVAFSVLESLDLELVGVVDDSPSKWGLQFHHLTVRPPSSLKALQPDAIVITTSIFRDEIFAKLEVMDLGDVKIQGL